MPEDNWTDKECKSTDYITPAKIIDRVSAYFGGQIPLDPATFSNNPTGAAKFYTKEDDGLKQPWDRPWFCNPPYGVLLRDGFCPKIHESSVVEGQVGIGLLPCGARFSTPYWQHFIMNDALNVRCYILSRVSFLRPDGTKAKGNPYDSKLYGYNVDIDLFVATFEDLGLIEYDGRFHRSEAVKARIDKALNPPSKAKKKKGKKKRPTRRKPVARRKPSPLSMHDGFE